MTGVVDQTLVVSAPGQPIPTISLGHMGQRNGDRRSKRTSYLIKKQKQNVILDDGDGDIPFSAMKEQYKYAAFVTKINPNADIERIRSHVTRLLTAHDTSVRDISIKPKTLPGSSWLSFGLFCKSDKDDIDLRMTGLWPKGTKVDKWKSKGADSRTGHSGAQYNRGSQYNRQSPHTQGSHNYNTNDGNAADGFNFTRPDQLLLHSQHV